MFVVLTAGNGRTDREGGGEEGGGELHVDGSRADLDGLLDAEMSESEMLIPNTRDVPTALIIYTTGQ